MRSTTQPHATARRPSWRHWLLAVLLILVATATVALGIRTYRTYTVLVSAYETGSPMTSNVRPWMTLRYVATTYHVPVEALRRQLELPAYAHPDATLVSLADRAGAPRRDYVQRVQRAIATVSPQPVPALDDESVGGLGGTGDDFVSAVLVYGYPALALTLLLGALGVPLPAGLAMVVAGSLAARGQMHWGVLAAVATTASLAGDLAGYAIGRVFGDTFLNRWGRWLGVTPSRRVRAERLFDRWGAAAILLSRSLVSALGSAVNLVAGAGRYRLGAFAGYGIAGRVLWTALYMGLGYFATGALDPAADFLKLLTGLLVALALCAVLIVALRRSRVAPRPSGSEP